MITRDVFGKIDPHVGTFHVQKRHDGRWEIVNRQYCITSSCVYNVKDGLLWIPVEPFKSMVQAYAYIKANHEYLI